MSAVFPVLSPHSPLQAMAARPTSLAVAYQGAPGAYSEGAAAKALPGCQPLPCEQFESAFEALSQWRAERAVLPIENSLGGSIHAVYDLLLKCAGPARLQDLGSGMSFWAPHALHSAHPAHKEWHCVCMSRRVPTVSRSCLAGDASVSK